MGLALAAMGTHPWANYLDQQIIDTEHYNRLRAELRWVAQRNNTWSLHVHVGVRGADRAIAVCDHLRGLLPVLLAVSANSPFLDNCDTGLHSVRTEIFTRTFPRCGVHEPFGDYDAYADFVDLLQRTNSIVESTQLWWSVRPHHRFGTVELRICDAQTRGDESFQLAGLIAACIGQSAIDYEDGALPEPLRQREVEENLWRAIRHGLDGRMIDFDRGQEISTRAAADALIEWATPAAGAMGIDLGSPGVNGAQRAIEAHAGGVSIREIYRGAIAETRSTYVPAEAAETVASRRSG
jgi:carboxylate-amine ligase